MAGEVSHIGVYFLQRHDKFFFYAGSKTTLTSSYPGLYSERVALLRIPGEFSGALAQSAKNSGEPFKVGWMRYRISKTPEIMVAESVDYYPKDFVRSGNSRGLGAFLERTAVQHLGKIGVTHITTTYNPSCSRKKQLAVGDLPTARQTPINEWLLGLDRIIKLKRTGKGFKLAGRV